VGAGPGLYMYDVVLKKLTFAISSPDEFLSIFCIAFPVFVVGEARYFKFSPGLRMTNHHLRS